MDNPTDSRDKLISNPFSYKITKEHKMIISRNNKQIKIISGKIANDLLVKMNAKSEQDIQLILAKITGHYKHGNESNNKT
jgi:hypothetical protein